ncbi:serine/threonine-protein kinase [Nocardia mexicana]|uniref:Serine/threonine protein kinase n=1 Tax=Nocardia mexicana TaxID=279262 RepID=A0A370GTU0_9NOCA|nr:serine/threonine-protein kinase [Nocardia mexicana]RDI47112.1 serine/threonine protein kinase [Nocardia mexicana]
MSGLGLGTAVARFDAEWQAALSELDYDPPSLAQYVPEGGAIRVAVLADLVRIDLRQRWRRTRHGKRMADYGKEFPELAASPQFLDLVCEEFALRNRYRRVTVADFLDEYPELAAELTRRIDAGDPDPSGPGSTEAYPDTVEVSPGHRIDDFDLVTLLGGTEDAKVFLARQHSMQRLVAVRVETVGTHDTRTVAQLDHPYIVRVFDQRVISGVSGGPLRLQYMQYLPGGSGADLLRLRRSSSDPGSGALLLRSVDAVMEARGEIRPTDSSVRAEIAALSWPETVAWVGRRLAAALDYAGHQDVVHGDIKPANVVFTAEGIAKLADFAAADHSDNTVAQPVSMHYWAPEQLSSSAAGAAVVSDARTDLYALGVLLWELLTGASPFDDAPEETPDRLAARRLAGVTEAAEAQLPSDTPATLRRTLLRCLEPDPRLRWQSGAELAGQLDLCLDARARDLVDPPPTSLRYRARGWSLPIVWACVGLPNLLASLYNIRLNESLIIDRLSVAAQDRYSTVGLINNLITFPLAAVLMTLLTWRVLVVTRRLRRRVAVPARELAVARRQLLSLGDRLVWVPFGMWLVAGIAWPTAVMATGVALPARNFLHFYTAQVVCAAIALAYPFFLVTVYAVRSVYPQLLVAGAVGPEDGRQLWRLAGRANFYLAAAASVPLLGVASATLVPGDQLGQVIDPVRVLSVGGILAFVLSYRLFRLLEMDLRALARVIPRGVR